MKHLILHNQLTHPNVCFDILTMQKIYRYFWLALCIANGYSGLQAKHIIGGDMYYECVSRDSARNWIRYRITMKLYRDCSNPEGALFDRDAKFGIYEKYPDGRYRFVDDITNVDYQQPIRDIDPDASNPCLIVPPGVCVQEATYQFLTGNLTILKSGSYVIAYQRCCRNETITNIDLPGEAGAALTLEITAASQQYCNNSPRFRSFPPVVICVNNPLQYDHSATDQEGDSIVYSFCTPLTSGGQDGTPGGRNSCFGVTPDPSACLPPYQAVSFRSPLYNTNTPLGGNPVVQINPVTGLISGTPLVQGQFVVGVCMREYRNAQLLTETRRDFQFNVAFCEPKVFAKITADSTLPNSQIQVINSCGPTNLDFTNRSTDAQYIFSYHWEFDMQGILKTDNNRDANFTFPQLGSYDGKMVVNRGTQCADSLNIRVNIYPDIGARYDYRYDTCKADPVIFTDRSYTGASGLTSWNWDFAGNGNSISQNPQFQFTSPGLKLVKLTVKDVNGCIADTVAPIRYYPVPPLLIIDPDTTQGCSPLKVCLNNLSSPIDSSYKVFWDFGDGNSINAISPCHSYDKGGIYSLKLEVTSPIGCYTERFFNQLVQVRQSPVSKFSYSPLKLTSLNRKITLMDESEFSSTRRWSINQNFGYTSQKVQHEFRDSGIQEIQLVAISFNGCTDTLIQYIDIEPIVTYFLPNAFTPNGDSHNDEFVGVGYLDGLSDFSLNIWDRWGGLVFSTHDPAEAWNGRAGNEGNQLPNGVYVYQLSYKTPRKQLVENKGFVTLIR